MSGKDQSVISKEALMSTKPGKQIMKQALFKSKGYKLFNKYKKQSGLSLLEALISSAIVGIGFIAIFSMVNFSIQSNQRCYCYDKFTNIPQQRVELNIKFEYLKALFPLNANLLPISTRQLINIS